MAKNTTKAQRDKLKKLLKNHEHDPKAVDALPMANEQELLESVLKIHGVSLEQYRRDMRR